MKRFILVCLVAMVAGCGGGGGGSSAPACKTVDISSLGAVQNLTIAEPTNVTISGMNNTVNIEGASNICTLNVSGMGNLIHFNSPVSITTCTISGMDNTFEKPTAMALSCTDGGLGNTFFDY